MYLLTETASPFALERWAAFFANFGQFAKGFFYTLGISIGALIVALLLGLIFGAMSSTHNKVLRGISRVYVEIFQNTPLLVQFVVVASKGRQYSGASPVGGDVPVRDVCATG